MNDLATRCITLYIINKQKGDFVPPKLRASKVQVQKQHILKQQFVVNPQ